MEKYIKRWLKLTTLEKFAIIPILICLLIIMPFYYLGSFVQCGEKAMCKLGKNEQGGK